MSPYSLWLISGWSGCRQPGWPDCLWELLNFHGPFNITQQLHISSFRANSFFSLHNSSIQSVLRTTPPTPVMYPAADVMQVLTVGLGTSINGTNLPQELLYLLAGTIEVNSFDGRVSGIEYQYFRNILALPLVFCNINYCADQPYVPDTLIVNG